MVRRDHARVVVVQREGRAGRLEALIEQRQKKLQEWGALALKWFLSGGKLQFVKAGEDGDDEVFGDSGGDELDGGLGNDTLDGGEGNDTLKGREGDDVLTGGGDNDVFFFEEGDGDDVITDFDLTLDKVQVDVTGVATLGDLSITTSGGGHALIDFGPDGSIELIGVNSGDLDSSNFIFGPETT